MKRRNFFALLFAPLAARFMPNPKPAGEVIFWLGQSGIFKYQDSLVERIGKPCSQQLYWHGQPPFVVIDIPLKWPWENNA